MTGGAGGCIPGSNQRLYGGKQGGVRAPGPVAVGSVIVAGGTTAVGVLGPVNNIMLITDIIKAGKKVAGIVVTVCTGRRAGNLADIYKRIVGYLVENSGVVKVSVKIIDSRTTAFGPT